MFFDVFDVFKMFFGVCFFVVFCFCCCCLFFLLDLTHDITSQGLVISMQLYSMLRVKVTIAEIPIILQISYVLL